MNRSLMPLASLYGAGARLRRRAFQQGWLRSRRLGRPVISVGNMTVGGSGKTPLVALVAETLLRNGRKPAILTRGYRRKGRTDLIVLEPQPQRNPDARTTGDEPALLAMSLPNLPIIICADRFRAGQVAEERFGVDVHILDDGFQHFTLARDIDLVAIDVTQDVLYDALLPVGRLREPISALVRANIIVLTRTEIRDQAETEKRVREINPGAPIFRCSTGLRSLVESVSGRAIKPGEYGGRPVCAFCAIGNPGAFFSDLRRWGFQPVAEIAFRDHHIYSWDDVRRLNRAATEKGAAAFLTTEKDLMNLSPQLEFQHPLLACAIQAEIHDPEQFEQLLLAGIEQKQVGLKDMPRA